MTNLNDILNEWLSNLEFRQEFKKNPEAALKKAGFEVNASDLEQIRSLLKNEDSNSGNEELGERINK